MYSKPSYVRYDRVIKPFYERRLKNAKKHAKKMKEYVSKADKLAIPDNKLNSGSIMVNLLKTIFYAIAYFYHKHRIHRCANRVERLAERNNDFVIGSGGVYYDIIMKLDPVYAAKKERERQEDLERDRHCIHYGGGAYPY